jgi:hypothetical protein
MNRRNTVSVTPAMGASTVAGAMATSPIINLDGTGTFAIVDKTVGCGFSQRLRTALFYCLSARALLCQNLHHR